LARAQQRFEGALAGQVVAAKLSDAGPFIRQSVAADFVDDAHRRMLGS
jgi:hypothetical protein